MCRNRFERFLFEGEENRMGSPPKRQCFNLSEKVKENAQHKHNEVTSTVKENAATEKELNTQPSTYSEPKVIPLAARRAMFEKKSAVHSAKSFTFQPKLSVSQRAAMFENAARVNSLKNSQRKLNLINNLKSSESKNSSTVQAQQKDYCMKEASDCNMSVSSHTEEAMSTETKDSADDVHPSTISIEQAKDNIASSPEKSISDDVFVLPQQADADSKVVSTVISTEIPKESEKSICNFPDKQYNDSADKKCSGIEDDNRLKKTAPNDKLETSTTSSAAPQTSEDFESIVSQGDQISSKNNISLLQEERKMIEATDKNNISKSPESVALNTSDNTHEVVLEKEKTLLCEIAEDSIVAAQQENAELVEADKKILACLVNGCEGTSSYSSIRNSISEEETSVRQSEISSTNADDSEGEHADYESNLDSEFTAVESASEYDVGDSAPESKTGETENFSNLSDFEDDEVFDHKRSSAKLRKKCEGETDSLLTTEDETESNSNQKCPKVNFYHSTITDDHPLKSATSETSLYSEVTSFLETSHSQIYSSSESLGLNQGKENAEKDVAAASENNLVNTLGSYRKLKLDTSPAKSHSPSQEGGSADKIQHRIKFLQEEVMRQQAVVCQSSQALNLCHSTPEFSGSSEQIEAERLLLIASQKQKTYEKELNLLKAGGMQEEVISGISKTLILSEIKLPLKQVFKEESGSADYFMCLIHYGSQVIATQVISTNETITNNALCFSKEVKLENLQQNVSIVVEVYAMHTSKRNISRSSKKYHMKREQSKIRLSIKGKRTENKVLLTDKDSSRFSTSLKTSSFFLIGCSQFLIENSRKICLTMDQTPPTSPLEGTLTIQLQDDRSTAQKGFLTKFQDAGGYGLWNRLWCSLDSQTLSFWKYPSDEDCSDPLGIIDLGECVTEEVRSVSYDVCVRTNTILLVTVRQKIQGEEDTIVSKSVGKLTTTRYLLSADSKEERITWCNKINAALANVRKGEDTAPSKIKKQKIIA